MFRKLERSGIINKAEIWNQTDLCSDLQQLILAVINLWTGCFTSLGIIAKMRLKLPSPTS